MGNVIPLALIVVVGVFALLLGRVSRRTSGYVAFAGAAACAVCLLIGHDPRQRYFIIMFMLIGCAIGVQKLWLPNKNT